MLTSTSDEPRAWRASSIDDRSAWYYTPQHCLAALAAIVRELARDRSPLTELRASDHLDAACAKELQLVRDALEHGRGFAVIQGLARDGYTNAELQTGYWLMGQLLGQPFEQNVQGTLLYDVRDEGKDVRYGARFSVTNAATGFHTDNSFGQDVLDYVGLLCLNAARSGGVNQVVSGYTVHNELRARHPEVLDVLYQTMHFDRRGGLRPGDALTVSVPILQGDAQDLLCRYLRYWIEAGHEKIGQPLTATQKHALDVLDGTLGERDLQAEFKLKPGEIFLTNNRWIFHNRTAFEDHAEPEQRRHYVRLWLRRKHPPGSLPS